MFDGGAILHFLGALGGPFLRVCFLFYFLLRVFVCCFLFLFGFRPHFPRFSSFRSRFVVFWVCSVVFSVLILGSAIGLRSLYWLDT